MKSFLKAFPFLLAVSVAVGCGGDKGGVDLGCEAGDLCDCIDTTDCPTGEVCGAAFQCVPDVVPDAGDTGGEQDTVEDTGPVDAGDDATDADASEPDVPDSTDSGEELDTIDPPDADAGQDVVDSDTAEDTEDGADVVEPFVPLVNPWVAYVRVLEGLNQVVVQRLDGRDLRVLDFPDSTNEGPAWSPDGQRLAMISFVREGGAPPPRRRLRVMTLATGDSTLAQLGDLSQFTQPCFSPDGESIVVSGRRSGETFRLWTYHLEDETLTALMDDGDEASYPNWLSPDWIYYTVPGSGQTQLERIRPDGSDREVVYSTGGVIGGIAVSREAEHAAWVRQTGEVTADLVIRDLAAETEITVPGNGVSAPNFAPDGLSLVHDRVESGDPDIFGVSVADGSQLYIVSAGAEIDGNARLSPLESDDLAIFATDGGE